MKIISIFRLALIGGTIAALGGCAGGYGYGGGGVQVGYADGYGGPLGYGGDYYGGIGYPSYGYFNDFYYPGTGIYVFDRGGRRRQWNDAERSHWQHRGGYRGNHLYQGRTYDARRDRAYATDRGASYRAFRQGTRQGGGEGQRGFSQQRDRGQQGQARGQGRGRPEGGQVRPN